MQFAARPSCDRFEVCVARFQIAVARLQRTIPRFQLQPLFRHGRDHRLERVNVVGKLRSGARHHRNQTMFAAVFPPFPEVRFTLPQPRQPTDCGRFTATGRTLFQSSPSTKASSCAWFS